jgi:hypothetical protein
LAGHVAISISSDAALVLLEVVATLNETGAIGDVGDAERRVLWDLEADLEAQLAVVTAIDYRTEVENARSRIRGQEEGG